MLFNVSRSTKDSQGLDLQSSNVLYNVSYHPPSTTLHSYECLRALDCPLSPGALAELEPLASRQVDERHFAEALVGAVRVGLEVHGHHAVAAAAVLVQRVRTHLVSQRIWV